MFNLESILFKTVFSCKSSGNISEAKQFLLVAEKYSLDISVLDEIAYLQYSIKDYKSCIKTLNKILNLTEQTEQRFSINANLAKVYNHLNDPNNSLRHSIENLEFIKKNNLSTNYDTLMEISFSHYLLGDYQTSEKMMRELIDSSDLPDNIKGRVLYNLGSYDIEKGYFKKGLKGFIEIGHKIGIWHHQEIPEIPFWDGSVIENKTLYIIAEGGIGDEIVNVRFMKNIKEIGMNPVWVTGRKDIAEVFNRNGFNTIVDINSIEKQNSVQCMSMYLPILLNLDECDLYTGPYLKPCDDYIKKWERKLPKNNKLGVKWSGNPDYDQDLHRSIPIEIINQIKFNGSKINLQLETEFCQENMLNVGNDINSIEDTLAIIYLCDLTITSCTSIAHMIGAMGCKGFVFPPIASYYVWLGSAKWYGSNLKVTRQTIHKDWNFVLNELKNAI